MPEDTYDQIVTFAHVLHECGQVSDCDELLAYFDRPWRWQKERDKFHALGGRTDQTTLNAMAELWANGDF